MVRPIGDKLVVKRDDLTTPPDIADRFLRKDSKIIIPDKARARSRYGRVLAVGPDVKEHIRQGDRVLISWLDGTKYSDRDMGDVELFLETEILAIVND